MNRRQMLKGIAASALVAGFDTVARRWVSAAEVSVGLACAPFANTPPLDGALYTDAATRQTDATDNGQMVRVVPCAVLRPGSVEDIAKMIRFCRLYGIKVATRGQAHTTFGQSLSPGLVIENRSLNQIHSIGPDGADVDAGVRWKDLIIRAYDEQRLTPAVITGYTNLSVGGTLSVGGISGRNYAGAQVDHVRELEVVTGAGDVRRCSLTQRRELFEVVLAGLGQCAAITRVKLDLVPAKSMARLYNLTYLDNATFFQDFRTLIRRGELDECYNLCAPGPGGSPFVYQIQAVSYFDPDSPPDTNHLFRGLSVPPAAAVFRDQTYLDWILSVDVLIDLFRATARWDELVKPWFDVWLPDSTVEQYVGEVMPTLTPLDVGPTGFLLLFALRRTDLTRPFFRMPDPEGGEWVYLFDILTSSALPGPDPLFSAQMLARNRRLFERARELGATRYPIGSLEFDRADWARQYGEMWPEFKRRKRKYDPDDILTPGPGIF
jgi:FAD/FMN-containing dehydrogenase